MSDGLGWTRGRPRGSAAVPIRALIAFVAALFTVDGHAADPKDLASEITKRTQKSQFARDTESEDVIMDFYYESTTVGVAAREQDEEDGPAWLIDLVTLDCSSTLRSERGNCRPETAIPLVARFDPNLVDARSVTVTAPIGAEDESGYTVDFGCRPGREYQCVETGIAVGFRGYRSCEDRECTTLQALSEEGSRLANLGRLRINKHSIGCPSAAACEDVADLMRELIKATTTRPELTAPGELDTLLARLNEAVVGAEWREDPVDESLSLVAGYALSLVDAANYRAARISLDPDGTLHIGMRVCAEQDRLSCTDDDWISKISHVSLPEVDPDSIDVFALSSYGQGGRETRYEGRALAAKCMEGDSCVTNAGTEASGLRIFFPCGDEASCFSAKADLIELVAFAGTPAFAGLVEERLAAATAPSSISDLSEAREAVRRIAENFGTRPHSTTLPKIDGLVVERRDGAALREDGVLTVVGSAHVCAGYDICPSSGDRREIEETVRLAELDPTRIAVDEYASEGENLAVRAPCHGDDACKRFTLSDAPTGYQSSELVLPCRDTGACYATVRELRALIAFAPSLTSAATIDQDTDTELPDFNQADLDLFQPYEARGALVADIARASGTASFTIINADGNRKTTYRTREVALGSDGRLAVALEFCDFPPGGSCGSASTHGVTQQRVAPNALDIDTIYPEGVDGEGVVVDLALDFWLGVDAEPAGYFVTAGCREDRPDCVEYNEHLQGASLYIACPDEETCLDLADALAELAKRPPPTETVDLGELPFIDYFNPGVEDSRRPVVTDRTQRLVATLDGASRDTEIKLRATEPGTVRVMRGAGASVTPDGRIRIQRLACLALHGANLADAGECRNEQILRRYDLLLVPSSLDPLSLRTVDGSREAGETGSWVRGACLPGEACARIERPIQPNYPVSQFDNLLASYGDTEASPAIIIPCGDWPPCEQVKIVLSALIDDATAVADAGRR